MRRYDYLGLRTDDGFAEYIRAPAKSLIPIPPNVDCETAVGTEPAAVALHGLRRAYIEPKGSVAILGVGPNPVNEWEVVLILGEGSIQSCIFYSRLI